MLIPKTYDLLDRCVCDGIAMGYKRAFKHTDCPSEEAIKENIHREVMNEIHEWFDINDTIDSSKLPIGVPVMTPDGKIVVNVGEGGSGGITHADLRRDKIGEKMKATSTKEECKK